MKLFDFQRETLMLISLTSALFVLSSSDFIVNPMREEVDTAIAQSYVWCEQWNDFCSFDFDHTYNCWDHWELFNNVTIADALYDATQSSGLEPCASLTTGMLGLRAIYTDGENCRTSPWFVKLVATYQIMIPLIALLPRPAGKKRLTLHCKFNWFMFAHLANIVVDIGLTIYLVLYISCFHKDTAFALYLMFGLCSVLNIVFLLWVKKQTPDSELKDISLAPVSPQSSVV